MAGPEAGGRREGGGPLAVIDIGSNSGRVVVYRVGPEGGFRIQATTRAALRLVREVDEGHALSDEAIARTLDALRCGSAGLSGVRVLPLRLCRRPTSKQPGQPGLPPGGRVDDGGRKAQLHLRS